MNLPEFIKTVLLDAREDGLLKPVNDHGWRFMFSHYWNEFVAKGAQAHDYQLEHICDTLSRIVYTQFVLARTEEAMAEAINGLTAQFKTGTLTSDASMATVESSLMRGRFAVRLVNWHPEYYDMRTPDAPLGLPDLRPTPSARLTFPTGELYVVDWPRIEGLREITDGDFDINYAQQRVDRTLHNITTFNFIEIAVGNTCPSVYGDATSYLQIGHERYDEETDAEIDPGLEELCNVCTDYWAVTIIDKADVIRLLEMNGHDAKAAIAEWENGAWFSSANVLQVTPGEWEVTWIESSMAAKGKGRGLEAHMPMKGTMDTRIMMRKL